MRICFILFTLLLGQNIFACSDLLKSFSEECKFQDRYERISKDFTTYKIKVTDLKGFQIPKAIGKASYFSSKNDLLNKTDSTLSKNKDWTIWNNGQKFILDLSPVFIELSDISKLHKNLFNPKGFFNISTDFGKFRTNNGETNPKIIFNCSDKIINDKIFDLIKNYDLKSEEGYPLLILKNLLVCDDRNFSSADMYFYKGASVKKELSNWLNDLNDMLARYENSSAPDDLSPYNYLADMRRWFLAIKPFSTGNEEVIAAILDYSTQRLKLPPLSLGEITMPFLMEFKDNREITLIRINETLNFFESCLFETKTKLVSLECFPLK
jgi:hypothetical protein